MNKFDFCKTQDGSTGLYNNIVNDIYHSSDGALSESMQKFIVPSGFYDFSKAHSDVNILDICYGIGYNTKAALYFAKLANKKIKINIDALEIDEDLLVLSPFIKDTVPSLDLKIFLLNQLMKNNEHFSTLFKRNIKEHNTSLREFFEPHITNFYQKFCFAICDSNNRALTEASLHNIYYQYVSTRIKNGLKDTYYRDCSFKCNIGDARNVLTQYEGAYDFVFHDGFTPKKDPTLWTYEFLKLVQSKMKDNGIIVTYSNSTPLRSALIELGFYVGKIVLNGKQFGTIASMDKDNIKIPLDKEDIALISTRAGIMYHDKDFNLESCDIIINRKTEQNNSDRISNSKYQKGLINEKI